MSFLIINIIHVNFLLNGVNYKIEKNTLLSHFLEMIAINIFMYAFLEFLQ